MPYRVATMRPPRSVYVHSSLRNPDAEVPATATPSALAPLAPEEQTLAAVLGQLVSELDAVRRKLDEQGGRRIGAVLLPLTEALATAATEAGAEDASGQ